VNVADARTLTIQPYDRTLVKPIEKAIMESDLGLNPVTSGQTLRVPLPPLTEERRREITKVVKRLAEEGKVRREANDAVKKLLKDKEISEDEARGSDNDIQKLTDKFIAEVDTVTEEKEKEIMTV
jgi:ribosome recycling factor